MNNFNRYIIGFILGLAICFIFIRVDKNEKTISEYTKTIIDTIFIERDIQPVSFSVIGKLNATNSPIPIKTDTTGKIEIDNEEMLKQIQHTCHTELGSVSYDAIDKYILPEFIVSFDTIINRDTFNLRYEFPQNLFHFDFEPHKDSIMFQQITTEHRTTKTKTNYLKTFIIATGSCVAGYLIGSSRK